MYEKKDLAFKVGEERKCRISHLTCSNIFMTLDIKGKNFDRNLMQHQAKLQVTPKPFSWEMEQYCLMLFVSVTTKPLKKRGVTWRNKSYSSLWRPWGSCFVTSRHGSSLISTKVYLWQLTIIDTSGIRQKMWITIKRITND